MKIQMIMIFPEEVSISEKAYYDHFLSGKPFHVYILGTRYYIRKSKKQDNVPYVVDPEEIGITILSKDELKEWCHHQWDINPEYPVVEMSEYLKMNGFRDEDNKIIHANRLRGYRYGWLTSKRRVATIDEPEVDVDDLDMWMDEPDVKEVPILYFTEDLLKTYVFQVLDIDPTLNSIEIMDKLKRYNIQMEDGTELNLILVHNYTYEWRRLHRLTDTTPPLPPLPPLLTPPIPAQPKENVVVICPGCRTRLPETAKFCTNCGSDLRTPHLDRDRKYRYKRGRWVTLVKKKKEITHPIPPPPMDEQPSSLPLPPPPDDETMGEPIEPTQVVIQKETTIEPQQDNSIPYWRDSELGDPDLVKQIDELATSLKMSDAQLSEIAQGIVEEEMEEKEEEEEDNEELDEYMGHMFTVYIKSECVCAYCELGWSAWLEKKTVCEKNEKHYVRTKNVTLELPTIELSPKAKTMIKTHPSFKANVVLQRWAYNSIANYLAEHGRITNKKIHKYFMKHKIGGQQEQNLRYRTIRIFANNTEEFTLNKTRKNRMLYLNKYLENRSMFKKKPEKAIEPKPDTLGTTGPGPKPDDPALEDAKKVAEQLNGIRHSPNINVRVEGGKE